MYTIYLNLTYFCLCYTITEVMKSVTAKYARQNFAEILNEVHFGKKKIVITRSGKPLVVLTSIKDQKSEKIKQTGKGR